MGSRNSINYLPAVKLEPLQRRPPLRRRKEDVVRTNQEANHVVPPLATHPILPPLYKKLLYHCAYATEVEECT